MLGLINHAATMWRRTRRDLAPVGVGVVLVAVTVMMTDDPLLPICGRMAAIMCGVAVWLTMAVLSATTGAYRAMLVAATRSHAQVVAAELMVAGLAVVGVCMFGVFAAVLLNTQAATPLDPVVGLGALLAASVSGMALGLACSAVAWRNRLRARIVAAAITFAMTCIPGVPGPRLLMSVLHGDPDVAAAWVWMGGYAAVAVVLFAAAWVWVLRRSNATGVAVVTA